MGKFRKRKYIIYPLITMLLWGSVSCKSSTDKEIDSIPDPAPEVIIKRRDDGTRSSVNQMDEWGRVHGTRITYYSDGKTIYSKRSFNHGKKHGPSVRYYKNGQIYKYTSYKNGLLHGPVRKYYKDGKLLSECEYINGNINPGLKEYLEDGALVTSYPEVTFKEIDYLASKNRIDLEISCSETYHGIKYFLLQQGSQGGGRVYLITENGRASQRYYIEPGDTLDRTIEIIAEIPTYLGNVMAKKLSYHLTATHSAN